MILRHLVLSRPITSDTLDRRGLLMVGDSRLFLGVHWMTEEEIGVISGAIRGAIRGSRRFGSYDDLYQDCWAHILEKLSRYKPTVSLGQFSFFEARHCYWVYMQEREKRAHEINAFQVSPDDSITVNHGTKLSAKDRERIWGAVDSLYPRWSMAVKEYIMADRLSADVIEDMGITFRSLQTYVKNSKRKLRVLLSNLSVAGGQTVEKD